MWRIQNGELDYVKPKAIVLHVGTNNFKETPDQIIDGIIELINTIREKQADAYIVLPVNIKNYTMLYLNTCIYFLVA